jgi:hypothetical protein
MAHFAKINDNNEVLSVFYIDDEKIKNNEGVETEFIGQQYLETHNNWPAEKWIKTSYNTKHNIHQNNKTPFRGNYAGIGYIWDSKNNMFFGEKPFPSWVKNISTASWEAPIAKPDLTSEQESQNIAQTHTWTHEWDENNQSWNLVNLGPEKIT